MQTSDRSAQIISKRQIPLKRLWYVIAILVASCVCKAVVIRHDIPDSKYRVAASEFPALVFLPGEGHGVLIAKQWVVTAAHAAVWRPIHQVTINGVSRVVAKVVVHPDYKPVPKEMKSGDAEPLMKFLATSDDIALIKLERPVDDVTPFQIYRGTDEVGRIIEMVGRGATGNGLVGQYPQSPHAGELRRAYSRVIGADEKWLVLKFDAPPDALDLEGAPADGDSGAPIFIETDGGVRLAGLVSRKLVTGKLSEFRCCLYGQITYQVRISHFATWIDNTVAHN